MTNNTNTDTNTITLAADDVTANALVANIRAAVNGARKYIAYVEAHTVTRDTVKDHARALAALAYPKDEPVQKKDGKRTRFGNAVQAAGNGLRAALTPEDSDDDTGTRNLLTADGVKALAALTPEQVIERVMAEITARAKAE